MRRVYRQGRGTLQRPDIAGDEPLTRGRTLWLAAAGAAVLAVVALWAVPRLQAPTGTLLILVSARSETTLAPSPVVIGQEGSWTQVGTVIGAVPRAPDTRQEITASLPAGAYDTVRVGGEMYFLSLTITPNQVEPLLLGVDGDGHFISGAAYAGNDEVNLGLGELGGRFVAIQPFHLVDQKDADFTPNTIEGQDLVFAAFHTTCHETCPIYTALFLQLARRLPPNVTLVEVTTDPVTDTPAALMDYSRRVGVRWTLATGSTDDVAAFWKQFGVELSTGDTHTSSLVLVDSHGYVRLVYRGVPDVGHEVPPALLNSMSAAGLHELASGGDGWGAPDVLQALLTIGAASTPLAASGGKAPDFSLTSTDGTSVKLASLAGKPLVVNFWRSDCPPCKAEMPLLSRDVPPSGAQLVLVNWGQGAEVARSFLASLGIRQPALLDSDLSTGRAYGVGALPTTVFVRADGTIDRRQVGQLDPAVLASELSKLVTQ